MKIVIWIVAIAIVAWAGFTILNQNGTDDTGPIKVGFISPLTGDAAVYGEPSQKVVQLAVEEINATGGINGREIEVVYEDGKCNGRDAASAMQKLVNVDKVKFVIGGFCSSESLAAAPIADENKVILFSPGSSSPDLTGISKYFLRNYPSDAFQGKVLAEVAFNQKEWQKVAVIHENTDYALGLAENFKSNFEALGGETIIENFAPETTDFRTVLAKLKAEDPAALFISVQTPQAAETILKQMKELGWSPNLIGADVIPGSDLPKEQPELVEGMLVAEFGFDRESPAFQAFTAAYKEAYGEEAPFLSYAQTEYDAVYMLADAFREVGTDVENVLTWLKTAEGWTGVSGAVAFDDGGDRTIGHQPEVIQNGEVVPLKTPDGADTETNTEDEG